MGHVTLVAPSCTCRTCLFSVLLLFRIVVQPGNVHANFVESLNSLVAVSDVLSEPFEERSPLEPSVAPYTSSYHAIATHGIVSSSSQCPDYNLKIERVAYFPFELT